MPELPEVETIKNALQKTIGQATITKASVLNRRLRRVVPESFEESVKGVKITRYQRIAKYIVIGLNNGLSIIWHLGMSGRIKVSDNMPKELDKHDHVVIETTKGFMIYNDARRFGLLDICPTKDVSSYDLFKRVGIDPFDTKLDAKYLFEKVKDRNVPIKNLLLDQSIINGIGNIYASEALYEARIDPRRKGADLSLKECRAVVLSVIKTLEKAIAAGGSTLKDYKRPDGSMGYFQNLHCVYNKTGQQCPDCKCNIKDTGGIQKIVLGGRSTFYCATLQR